MSILPICITGEPVLHRVAAPIDSFDSELSDLVADMIETMHAAPGVGLAAPQVGVGSQIFVWRYAGGGAFDSRYRDVLQLDEGPRRGFNTALSGVVVNPTLDLVWDDEGAGAILPTRPDATCESEGCLSVPGYGYPPRRALGAVLRGFDVSGAPIEGAARGRPARFLHPEYAPLLRTPHLNPPPHPSPNPPERRIGRGARPPGPAADQPRNPT